MTYLEATDREYGEKWSAKTRPDEKACRNYLGCQLINSDQSLQSHSTTNHGVCIHYVGNSCQNQQEQAGQSPEHGSASHTWSHENHPSALHGKNSLCGATWEEKSENPHPGRKTEKAAFPPSTHKPGTVHQKSPQTPKPEPPVQRTVQDTPWHCGCASRAADRSCLEAQQRGRHTNVSERPRHHLKGTAPWRAQTPHASSDRWQIPSHCLDSCLHWWVCWGGDEKWWQRCLHQILRWWHHLPLSSWWPSVLQLSSWDTGYLYSCRAPVGESRKKMGNIAIFTDSLSLVSTLQALNSADPDQMIQGLHSSLAKLTAQFSVSLQWVPAHVGLTGNEKADSLAKIGSQAPQTQNPVTYREAKALLHSRYNGDWKKDNGGY